MALSVEHRSKLQPSLVMVTSPYKWKILQWDKKPEPTNKFFLCHFYFICTNLTTCTIQEPNHKYQNTLHSYFQNIQVHVLCKWMVIQVLSKLQSITWTPNKNMNCLPPRNRVDTTQLGEPKHCHLSLQPYCGEQTFCKNLTSPHLHNNIPTHI